MKENIIRGQGRTWKRKEVTERWIKLKERTERKRKREFKDGEN